MVDISSMPRLSTLSLCPISVPQYPVSSCIGAPAESNMEKFPVKIWPEKLLHGEKSLDFLRPCYVLHNLVHPVEMMNNWYSPMNFWASSSWFEPNKFHNFTLVTWLKQFLVLGSFRDHKVLCWLFPNKIVLSFFAKIN